MHDLLGNTTFWYFLSFVVFVIMAYRFGAAAVTSQLDNQIQEVKKKIETAESLRVEAQELLAQYQRKQRDALKEADQIIDKAKESAEKIRAKSEADLEASIAKREEMVEKRITRMQEEAVHKIKTHAADLAMRAAQVMIEENIESGKDGGLMEESIKNISSQIHQ